MRPPFTTRPTWPSAMPGTSIGRGKGDTSIGQPGCWSRRRYRQSVGISSAPACREVPCDPCGAPGRRQTRPAPISAALAASFSRTKRHQDIESVTGWRPSTHKSEPRFVAIDSYRRGQRILPSRLPRTPKLTVPPHPTRSCHDRRLILLNYEHAAKPADFLRWSRSRFNFSYRRRPTASEFEHPDVVPCQGLTEPGTAV
jgi:hypothetical protein